eukprot:TRINITY_DN10832_c1_g1_i2.p1 TRINITY_DN10832_c1_g1~~TRINITY_DN10832_c1_g1_i2.p1  ORF type:complete len:121 (+),score=46.02 TRINITY_DN10832_c1_g1_i2:462-824(+)
MAQRGVNSKGVKALLEAEAKAAEKVKRARNEKVQKMKQAKQLAAEEIEKFKASKQSEFDSQATANVGTGNDDSAQIQKDTEAKLKGLQESVSSNQEDVISKLLDIVCKVDVVVHENYVAA